MPDDIGHPNSLAAAACSGVLFCCKSCTRAASCAASTNALDAATSSRGAGQKWRRVGRAGCGAVLHCTALRRHNHQNNTHIYIHTCQSAAVGAVCVRARQSSHTFNNYCQHKHRTHALSLSRCIEGETERQSLQQRESVRIGRGRGKAVGRRERRR